MSKPAKTITTKTRKENAEATIAIIKWLTENPNGAVISTDLNTGKTWKITIENGELEIQPVVGKEKKQ